ncbi:MAG: S1 RNA-binding domain-containing protein [Acidobacteria bacterium]|nr:S1 RNA-binding domain-containing protein [Acidobacteriota bacterium]MCA1638100.1 S1 RNA-binding domain-containing protein [Acidobacteriota bacterium]
MADHKPGDVVRGKISRFAGFGVFVQLGEELEGLCHISELSDDRVEKPEDVVSLGQEMDFKILRIESDVQKIGLSARAVGKVDEPAVDTKMYTTEAKGGMASLGELMNLRRGKAAEPETQEEAKTSKKERKAQKEQEKNEQQITESTQTGNKTPAIEVTETFQNDTQASAEVDQPPIETSAETSGEDATAENTFQNLNEATGTIQESETAFSETDPSVSTSEDSDVNTAKEQSAANETASESTVEATAFETDSTVPNDIEGEAASAPVENAPTNSVAETPTVNSENNESTGESSEEQLDNN